MTSFGPSDVDLSGALSRLVKRQQSLFDTVGQALSASRLRVEVGAGIEDADEEPDLLDLSGRGIYDRQLLPRLVDEGLLPRRVDLSHGGMELAAEALIGLADAALAVSSGWSSILDPEQLRRDTRRESSRWIEARSASAWAYP